MSIRRLTPLAAALAVAAVLPGAASAAEVVREGDALVVRAAPGEQNHVTVSMHTPGELSFGDSGVAWTSLPAGCDRLGDEYPVRCPEPARVRLELADGGDVAVVDHTVPARLPVTVAGGDGADDLKSIGGSTVALDGGAGADRLRSEEGASSMDGGAGDDELVGGAGRDDLRGGEGDDLLRADAGAPSGTAELIDGGAGTDTVDDWADDDRSAQRPVSVTLDGQANDGRPGEGDDVRDVEVVKAFVAGTWVMGDGPDRVESYAPADLGPSAIAVRGGDDVVLAGNGTQAIDGGAGADRLEGGFGDDTITGGPGRDTIAADVTGTQCGVLQSCTLPNGDDVVDARDGEADTVSCGVGTDRVVADTADVVAADCEQVDRAGAAGPAAPAAGAPAPGAAAPGATPARPVVVAGQRLRTALRRGLRVRVATAGTVRALHGRRTVATGRGRGVVTLRFTAAARRALAGRRTVRLTLVAGTARTTVTLRR